jgi:hypothetical protein
MVEECSEHDGQRGGFRQSISHRFGAHFCEGCKSMSREEMISAAYSTVKSINSLGVYRNTPKEKIFDVQRSYELRLGNMMESRILHQLPSGVSVRINDSTAEVELYVGKRKYSPRKK